MAKKDSDFIDLSAIFKQYLQKWWLFAISLACCVALAFFYLYIHKPVYAVRANLLINQDENDGSPANLAAGTSAFGNLFGNNGYVDDEIYIISSHSLYKAVAKDLGLGTQYYVRKAFLKTNFEFEKYPIKVTPQSGILDTLSLSITFKVKANDKGKTSIVGKALKEKIVDLSDITLPYTADTKYGTFTFEMTPYAQAGKSIKETILVQGYDLAAEQLDIDVMTEIASKRSNVVELGINTPYPVYGKTVLNKIIEQYNRRSIEQKNDQNDLTAKFIDARLVILAKDLNDIENEIQTYKQKRGIIDVNLEAGNQYKRKNEFEQALIGLKTQKEIIEMASEFIANPDNKNSLVPIAANAEGVPSSLNEYNGLLMHRRDMLTSAREDNASLILLDKRIDLLRANIMASFAKTLENVDVQIRDIERNMAEATAKLGIAPLSQREFLDLQRQQELKQGLYVFLLQRREEVAMVLANSFPKGTIVDRAFTLSKPLGLKNWAILLIALICGVLIPPVYLFIRRLINNVVEQRGDVEKATDIPVLGEMCIDNSDEKLIIKEGNNSSSAELFRLLRANLQFMLNNSSDKIVLFTSWSAGEGKSFISINLAAVMASMGKKVLLVGMDIRKPVLAKYLGITSKYGLTQYLSSSNMEAEQLIVPMPSIPNLDIVLAGPIPPNPAELLLSPRVDEFFNQMRQKYDYIFVDTAPIGLVSDTYTLNRISDATIFVCRVNRTKISVFDELEESYNQHRLKKLSIVVNGTASHKHYGYGN